MEVNAGPGLRMHLEPSAGKPRPVGNAIVEHLFPARDQGRIPVVAITGVNGKTTTTRLVAHLFRKAGKWVGMTCTDGIYLDGRRTQTRDCSGPRSARAVLLNPRVAIAILETARGGILREGLGFDQCSVAVITNIGKGDHLGHRGIETIEDLASVKEVVVRSVAPEGYAVLNAADPLVAAMAKSCPGKVIFWARDEQNPVLLAHRGAGGRGITLRGPSVLMMSGSGEEELLPLAEIPFTQRGQVAFHVDNALAAIGAAWALDLPLEQIRDGLRSFAGNAREVPGRFNVFTRGQATVIVDYAQNPSAVAAVVEAIEQFLQPRRTLVFSGCNRRDIDLVEMGEIAGHAFDRVVLYADSGNDGRADGELNALLKSGLKKGRRVREVTEMPSERQALEAVLARPSAEELIVLGVGAIEDSLAFVEQCLAGR